MAPRGSRVRFESSAKTAAKEAAGRSGQEATKTPAAKAGEMQSEAQKHIAAGILKAQQYSKHAAAGIAKAQEYSKYMAAGLARAGATAQALTKSLSESGGTTGRIASAIDSKRHYLFFFFFFFFFRNADRRREKLTESFAGQIPFVVYYSQVFAETFKIVARARNMAPP